MSGSNRFLRSQRLKSGSIERILASGRPRRGHALLLQLVPNGSDFARLAVLVPKRVIFKAVERNRFKRQVREWFRLNQARFSGRDLLVRLSSRNRDWESAQAELDQLTTAEQ